MKNKSSISPQDRTAAIDAYKALNDSVMQQKLRREKAFFVGAVYHDTI